MICDDALYAAEHNPNRLHRPMSQEPRIKARSPPPPLFRNTYFYLGELILLRLFSSLAKKEITLEINTKFVNDDIALIAAHLYSQISLLRYESLEYNLEPRKAIFLALNTIELAFAKHKKN